MRPVIENPFREATFDELSLAINDAVRTLQERPYRTRHEKEAFALRLRHLLLAVAFRFRNGSTIPGEPEMELAGAVSPDLEGAFMRSYARHLSDTATRARVITLYRAADFVLGRRGAMWVISPSSRPDRVRPVDHASVSEDGLRIILRELGALLGR